MKRFIRYLYEYEQGKRTRNVGFVKVEQGDDECIVHIHGKGLRMGGRQKLKLYLFFEDGKDCVGVLQGEVDNINPSVNYRLRYTQEDTGVPENYSRIDGIIMENDGYRKYAAVWDDMPVDVNHMREWVPEEEPQMEPELQPQPEEELRMEPEPELQPQPEEDMQMEPEPELRPAAASVKPRKIMKIQRKDIVRLPRCEWRLSNNQFLLHGYYNYRHLVLIQEGRKMWLGVPGIYHEKEGKAADALGFPEFIPADGMDIILSESERNDEEVFGYWCRQVKCFQWQDRY